MPTYSFLVSGDAHIATIRHGERDRIDSGNALNAETVLLGVGGYAHVHAGRSGSGAVWQTSLNRAMIALLV